ncbi:helix-turn-helix domain-containing protein [Paraburkholderia fungorum]|uniref:helix-turn-helix domain-containing protein n=1 Tax=Paraburkholderia fungorum TaxID=134537 RepID=UPI00402BCBDC
MRKETSGRLTEERLRLGLNKSQMASIGGVANSAYLRYENGERAPDGDFLTAIAAAGADVLYILTGQRSQLVAPQELLPEGDRIFLDNLHAAPVEVQRGVKITLDAFAPRGATSGHHRAHRKSA